MKKQILFGLLLVIGLSLAAGETYAQKNRKSVSGAEVTGTFRMNFSGKFKGSYNEIKIQALGRGIRSLHILLGRLAQHQGAQRLAVVAPGAVELDEAEPAFHVAAGVARVCGVGLGAAEVRVLAVLPLVRGVRGA